MGHTNGNQRGRAPGKDVMEMVKGITRQVILVKSPDPKLFEEAIFIVKEEALAREGVSADPQVIRQAPPGRRRLFEERTGLEPEAGTAGPVPGPHLGGGWSGGCFCGLVCRTVPAIKNLPNFLRET